MIRLYRWPPPKAFEQAPEPLAGGIFDCTSADRSPKSSAAWSMRSPETGKSKNQPARVATSASERGRPHSLVARIETPPLKTPAARNGADRRTRIGARRAIVINDIHRLPDR